MVTVTSKTYQRKARLREFTLLLIQRVELGLPKQGTSRCYFCNHPFIEADFPQRAADNVTIHHIDEDRTNNTPENLALAHKGCHKHYHFYRR